MHCRLAKLLDTSSAAKQKSLAKKAILDLLSDKPPTGAEPPSPTASPSTAKSLNHANSTISSKRAPSFRNFISRASSSSMRDVDPSQAKRSTSSSSPHTQLQPQNSNMSSSSQLEPSSLSLLPAGEQQRSTAASDLRAQQMLSQQQSWSLSYGELENEVSKIAYHFDATFKQWSRLSAARRQQQPLSSDANHAITPPIDMHNASCDTNSLLTALFASTSAAVCHELEHALFRINWLLLSKSGQNDSVWKTNVLSLTPATRDSCAGSNLLKTYYHLVKYDFVTYKMFTRQLQLVQLSALLTLVIHRIALLYKELRDDEAKDELADDGAGQQVFSFSSSQYRPISWSGNHVTLYNMQALNSQVCLLFYVPLVVSSLVNSLHPLTSSRTHPLVSSVSPQASLSAVRRLHSAVASNTTDGPATVVNSAARRHRSMAMNRSMAMTLESVRRRRRSPPRRAICNSSSTNWCSSAPLVSTCKQR